MKQRLFRSLGTNSTSFLPFVQGDAFQNQVAFLVFEEATKPTRDDDVIGPSPHPRLACHAGATPKRSSILRRTALARPLSSSSCPSFFLAVCSLCPSSLHDVCKVQTTIPFSGTLWGGHVSNKYNGTDGRPVLRHVTSQYVDTYV